MTLTTTAPHQTDGTAGVSRFTPTQLLRTARLIAGDPDLLRRADLTATERQWLLLDSTAHLEIWLLTWPAGADTGWHDHGGSAGAFLAVHGRLVESTWTRHHPHERVLTVGDGRSFGSHHVHDVANRGPGAAVSVHVYSPRLRTMNRFARRGDGLVHTATERAGTDW